MNISGTRHTEFNRLPRTSVDLARLMRAAREAAGKNKSVGKISGNNAFGTGRKPAVTYVPAGGRVVLRKKLTGALVDIHV